MTPAEPISVLIADDHTVARAGLKAMLDTDRHINVVGEAVNGEETIKLVGELSPRIVLMDVRMPKMDGLQATRILKRQFPKTAVIVLTSYDDSALVIGAVQAGAAGYLLKDTSREMLCHAINQVASGGILIEPSLLKTAMSNLGTQRLTDPQSVVLEPGLVESLTERERHILTLMAEGWTNKEIGASLSLAEVTIKKHVQVIIAKLSCSDRTHAAIKALRMGLIR